MRLLSHHSKRLESLGVVLEESEPEADKISDADNRAYEGSARKALVSIRVRQDFFRRSVLSAYGFRCCITGLSVPKLLVASHIVPWSVDAKNRLNPRNGLCLSVLHDKAFDTGLLTVNEDMTVRVSRKRLSAKDVFFKEAVLAYDGVAIRLPEKLRPTQEFLDYHRKHIFEAKHVKD